MHTLDGNAGARGSLTSVPNEVDQTYELLTVAEAAQWLKISIAGMRRLQQRRLVTFVKVGGSIRFAKRDLASYVERVRVASIG
jgi:excisionase family DNA binding protein